MGRGYLETRREAHAKMAEGKKLKSRAIRPNHAHVTIDFNPEYGMFSDSLIGFANRVPGQPASVATGDFRSHHKIAVLAWDHVNRIGTRHRASGSNSRHSFSFQPKLTIGS